MDGSQDDAIYETSPKEESESNKGDDNNRSIFHTDDPEVTEDTFNLLFAEDESNDSDFNGYD